MKKVLLILGILILLGCLVCLFFAALYAYGYHHVLDGEPSLYDRLHRRAILFSVLGGVLAAGGSACIVMHVKL